MFFSTIEAMKRVIENLNVLLRNNHIERCDVAVVLLLTIIVICCSHCTITLHSSESSRPGRNLEQQLKDREDYIAKVSELFPV